jgi:hypothetical protein
MALFSSSSDSSASPVAPVMPEGPEIETGKLVASEVASPVSP